MSDTRPTSIYGVTYLECAIAGCMLRELVSPEISVWRALVDPIGVHPVQEIVTRKVGDDIRDWRTGKRWNNCTIWQAIRCVWRRCWIVLSSQVAILGVRAIAEIRPQALRS